MFALTSFIIPQQMPEVEDKVKLWSSVSLAWVVGCVVPRIMKSAQVL